ncbi:MAG: glycosyltransferase [Phycisphaeraceae bacterium]|nr:glycosyltransferase [Phycisphaeraceae bacterium]
MRIALVNWAKIWLGASRGGGVNGYAQALALELVARGHEVCSVSSGTSPPLKSALRVPCHARRHPDWAGIRCFEIVGSPVRAPATFQFDHPDPEASSPELERVFGALIQWMGVEVVHFHSLEGLSAGCVEACLGGGARVVFSLHNYHTICPQVYLLRRDREVCSDFENGHACVGCHRPARAPRRAGLASRAVESAVDASGPFEVRGEDPRGGPDGSRVRAAGRRLPILNEVTPEPGSDLAPNAYSARRSAMVAALNRCDRVLAVSRFVARLFEARGVGPGVLLTMPIGTRMVDIAAAARTIDWGRSRGPSPDGPLRLVFLGYHNFAKGLDLLMEALEGMARGPLSRIRLEVHAMGIEPIGARIRRLEGHLAGLTVGGEYRYEDIPWLVDGADLGVVPSAWWDNAPQTVFEFHACGVPVLGAAVGGIPDFVREGENGMLFRGNDVEALRERLVEAAANPGAVRALRAGIAPPPSMGRHASDMEAVYRSVLAGSRG